MTGIMTVTGAQSPDILGFCQCHEHLMIRKGVSFTVNPALWMDDINKSMAEVRQFKQLGGGTIIDAQPGGCGRMAAELVQISKVTGVPIIAAAGFHKLLFYPRNHWIFTASQKMLQDIFIHELEVGMYTDMDEQFHDSFIPHRAGMIKAALDLEGLTPLYKKCFYAAAKAAIACQVPLMIHIEQGADPLPLLTQLLSWGVKPKQIIFCHLDRRIMPLSYYTEVLKEGISLELDTIGRFKYHSDQEEAQLFADLIAHGYEDQLLFSLDTTRERLRAYTSTGIGLSYLLTVFLPLLKGFGLTKEQLKKISHDNLIRSYGFI